MKIYSLIRFLLYRKYKYGWHGNYSSWENAKKDSIGYDSDLILDKVKNSLLKVKNGEAIYERDSILFDKMEYSWPLLAALLWIANKNMGKLNIIDFGGSLGSTYFQNRPFLKDLSELRWNIIEQKKFVECGQHYFEDDHLKFYFNLDECIAQQDPDAIILSSVLQYIESPYDLLEKIIGLNFTYIIFDRTSFLEHGKDRITVQKVPPHIYNASYPAWVFEKKKFLDFFKGKYELIAEFEAYVGKEYYIVNNVKAGDKGFIFRRV